MTESRESWLLVNVLISKTCQRYFRQLQELSDTVAEATWEGSVTEAIAKAEIERADLDVKINTGRARQRYLEHLAKSQEEGTLDEDEECCILCKCEFTRGYITQWCVSTWIIKALLTMSPKCPCILRGMASFPRTRSTFLTTKFRGA